MMRYLLGPEIFWGILYLATIWLGKLNQTSKSLDPFIESLWFWIPAMSTLVFGLWWIPSVEKSYLLMRIWICGLLGGHFVIERALSAYRQQGPGIGMGYLAGLMLEFFILMVGTIFVWIKF